MREHIGVTRVEQARPSSAPKVEINGLGTSAVNIALLTGGDDRPYALGMASALAAQGLNVDFIGSDKLNAIELHSSPRISFLNLRGDQSENAPLSRKVVRLLLYYMRLFRYVPRAKPKLFHILWNNKCEHFDRTLLMLYYRLFGKRIILTAHNVNRCKRDGCDGWFNRFTLRIQYRLCAHIVVHTNAMKEELIADFHVGRHLVSVIPFGINNTIASTAITCREAKERMACFPKTKRFFFSGRSRPIKVLRI